MRFGHIVKPALLVCLFLIVAYFVVHYFKKVHEDTATVSAWVVPEPVNRTRSCGALLAHGEICEDSFGTRRLRPQGCFMQDYTAPTPLTARCLESLADRSPQQNVRIVLMGDSRLRQLQHHINWLITGNWTDIDNEKGVRVRRPGSLVCDPPWKDSDDKIRSGQCNLTLSTPNLNFTVQRLWDPMIAPDRAPFTLTNMLNINDSSELPNIVIINSGAWLLKWCHDNNLTSEACQTEHRKIIFAIKPLLKRLSALTTVIWMPQTVVNRAFATLFLTHEKNGLISIFNDMATTLLADTNVRFWWSSHQAYERFNDTRDGIHQGPRTLLHNAQVVVNYLCNAVVSPPNSNYCCI
ncbi:hypothetical protein BV898_07121 [Hypsibius exemplaris]|uniref:Uncharacterized protein n=1 Tax=Hypsibius exemplaris TaxID=2072580 RepID=A0A1W0WUN7_HYPEX|nr:hypothetical protein BV898_07121 [Hypsibius exemplaris]